MATDLNYNNVTLLVHANGVNGSTTVIDNSSSTKTLTCAGNAQISTAQSVFGGSSLLFDGTGDYITIPTSTDLDLSTGDFTIEFRLYLPSTTQNTSATILASGQSTYQIGCRYLMIGSSRILRLGGNISGSSVDVLTAPSALAASTWYSIAVTKSGTSYSLYIDGAQVATGVDSNAYNFSTTQTFIGTNGWDGANGTINAYIDELRITKGIARYTGASYTPSIVEFPDTYSNTDSYAANTVLLLGFEGANASTNFIDSSLSKHTVSRLASGTATLSTTAVRSGISSLYNGDGTGTVNGLKLDGSADFSFGTGDFTIELSVYITTIPSGVWTYFYGHGASTGTNIEIGIHPSVGFSVTCGSITSYLFSSYGLPSTNTWYDIALVRSGATVSFYINGVKTGTPGTTSASLTVGATTYPVIGTVSSGGSSGYFRGYIDNVRVTKGIARYTGASYTVNTDAFYTNNNTGNTVSGQSITSSLNTITTSGGIIKMLVSGLTSSITLGNIGASTPINLIGNTTSSSLGVVSPISGAISNIVGIQINSILNNLLTDAYSYPLGNSVASALNNVSISKVKVSNASSLSAATAIGTLTTSGGIISLNLYRMTSGPQSGLLVLASSAPVGGTLVTGYNYAALALLTPWYRVQDTHSFGNTSEFHPFNYYLGPPEVNDVVNPDGTPTIQYGIGTILYLLAGQADDLVSVKDTSDYPRAIPSWNIVNDAANYSFIPAVLGSSNNNCPYIREIHSTDFYTIGLSGFTLTIDFRVRSVVNSSSNYLFYLGKLDNNFNGFALLLISYNAYSVSIGIVDSTNTEVYAETIDFDMTAHLNDNLEILFSRAAGSNDLVFELFSTNTLSWITKTQTKVDFTFPAFNTMAIGATSNTPTMYGNLDALFYKISLSVLNSTPIFPNGYNFTTINGTNTENILYRRKWSAPYTINYTPIEINFLDIPMAKKSTRGNALVTALVEVAHCNKYYIFELWIRPIVGIGEGPIYGPSTMLFRKEIDMTSRISTFTSSIIHPTVQWGGGVYKVTNSSTQPRGFIQSVKDTFGNTYQLAQSYFTVLEDMYSGINLPPPNSYYAFTDATGTYIKLYAPVPVANLLIEIANPTDVDLVYIVPKENLPIKDFQLSLVVGSTTDVVEGTYSSTLSYIEL